MKNNDYLEKTELIFNTIKEKFCDDIIKKDESMKKHTTFKVGGNADLFFYPKNVEQLIFGIKLFKEKNLTYYIMGNGSNLLISDKGIRGAVIQIFSNFSDVSVDGEFIYAQSGALLTNVANKAVENSLGGMEFASGIPGTIGGAVSMNAGAYGGEMKDIIVSADILDENENIISLTNKELTLGYRKSSITGTNKIVLGCKLKLEHDEKEAVKSRMSELAVQRREKQPLEFPSAGSTFKRPEGYFAGKLISDAGLKGYTFGGAMVSDKHAGFVINKGDATAEDILNIIDHCKNEVKKQFGVELEPEVKILGEL